MEQLIKKIDKKYSTKYLMIFILNETKKIEKLIIEDKIPANNLGQILDDLDILENKLIELKKTIS